MTATNTLHAVATGKRFGAALDRSRRCLSLFELPFMICCFAPSKSIASITTPTPFSARPCCRSRPAAVRRIAATARSRRATARSQREALLEIDDVVAAAQAAKDKGATRFCMGAAWRGPKDKDLDRSPT